MLSDQKGPQQEDQCSCLVIYLYLKIYYPNKPYGRLCRAHPNPSKTFKDIYLLDFIIDSYAINNLPHFFSKKIKSNKDNQYQNIKKINLLRA